jgi:hypothetical protein
VLWIEQAARVEREFANVVVEKWLGGRKEQDPIASICRLKCLRELGIAIPTTRIVNGKLL